MSSNQKMGLFRSTSLVVGNIVGAGLLMLPASLGVYGTLGLIGWGLTSIGAIFLALIFARLSKKFPKTGGPYAYSKGAFGEFVGFQMAWSYWIGTWASNAALAIAFVSYLSVFIPELNNNMMLSFIVSFASVWSLTLLNISGVRNSMFIQVIATVLKIIPLVAIGIFGIFFINPENYTPINPSGQPIFTAITAAAALTLFSFLGLESATIPADNVKDPSKTIPRATIIGTLIATVIYIGTMAVIMGIIPSDELANSPAPFAYAGLLIFGGWAETVIAASAIIAVLGTLNGWILLQGQIPLAAAKDGLFPKAFKITNSGGTPVFGLIVSAGLMTVMLWMYHDASLTDQFTSIVAFTTFAVLLPYLYSSVADLFYLMTGKYEFTKEKLTKASIVSFLGLAYTILIVIGSGQESVYLGMICIFLGFPVYAWMKRKKDNGEKMDR